MSINSKYLVVGVVCVLIIAVFAILFDKNTAPNRMPSAPEDIVGKAAHPMSSSFSSEGPAFSVSSNALRVLDTVVYKYGWYSVNGEPWQSLNLTGTIYNDHENWLSGFASKSLPDFGPGEHYVLIYSCNYANRRWDCHDNKWQLIVINNTETSSGIYGSGPGTESECGDVLDYQCGVRKICGSSTNYGNCPTGYDCDDNLCIASAGRTCDGVTCGSGEYCSNGVCLLDVPGDTYFVALWGDDSNPGTFDAPFYSWQKAVDVSTPGDITYIRGGVWQPKERPEGSRVFGMLISGPNGYNRGMSGTAEAPIKYYNYPGEKPILDGEFIGPDQHRWSSGISILYAQYIHLKGLTVRHIHQSPPDFTHAKPYSEVSGIGSNGANIRYENMVAHDIDGRGFQHWSGFWSYEDALYAVEAGYQTEIQISDYDSDSTTWINCDAYNLYDRYAQEPGNAADGWKVETYKGGIFTWEGCRAWNYADDGFDPHGSGLRIFDNCWAMATDKYAGLSDAWDIEGNGFKTTGSTGIILSPGQSGVIFKNSIAAFSSGTGFITNLGTEVNSPYSSRPLLYNNFAYRDGYGYSGGNNGTYINNIVYDSQNIGPIGEKYEIASYRSQYLVDSHNTWISNGPSESWPPWRYNPEFNVTDDDFVSLDASQLTRSRKADGSLPDITFGHLKQGSELIDAGAVIPGYHCPNVGEYPDDDCVEWYGTAPDLGPFESNYGAVVTNSETGSGGGSGGGPGVTPNCSDNVKNQNEAFTDCGGVCAACQCLANNVMDCNIPNGIGTQTMYCIDGRNFTLSSCSIVSCNTDYFINGSVCSYALCSGPANRTCDIANGIGIQYRTCTNGVWSNYGNCNLVSCNSGYTPSGNTCIVSAPPAVGGAIIADHRAARDFDLIPTCWLNEAKSTFKIAYQHTSHGSQIPSGMEYLRAYVDSSKYAYSGSTVAGALYFRDYDISGAGGYSASDLGYGYWDEASRAYLDLHPNVNTIMWSWCGQASGYTTDASMNSHYLTPAVGIITDYGINMIYMTGHLEGSGPTGALYQANNIIRRHVNATDGILFDFADIESWDPAGNYYPMESDACNWCTTWCNAHPTDCQNLPSCAHSHGFNCVQKGRAFWWMLARMSGWDGTANDACP